MLRRVKVAWCALLVLATGVVVAAGLVGVAYAHSGLAAASPGPGATVGGSVDRIQIFYGDIITSFDGTVTQQATGDQLAASSEMLSEIEAVITLDEPLADDGEYAVRHTITSFDGDVVEAAYLFSYDVDAAPPSIVFVDEEEDDGGTTWLVWAAFGVGLLVIVVLAVRLVFAMRRRRAASTPTA